MSTTGFEASLHSFVDDELDDRRRADTLARLAQSPADSERITNWRQQNQLLRTAFATVEAEPVPLSLSIARAPHVETRASPLVVAPTLPRPRIHRILAILVCGAAAAVSTVAMVMPVHLPTPVELRRERDAETVDPTGLLQRASLTVRESVATATVRNKVVLPDLSASGAAMLSATFYDDAVGPVACGTYVMPSHAHVVLCAEHLSGEQAEAQGHDDTPRVWHRGSTLYALAGDVSDAELATVAASIRAAMDRRH